MPQAAATTPDGDVDEAYLRADHHSVHMPLADAESLSGILARRLVEQAGRPDLLVGIANGAHLMTHVSGRELGIRTEMVQVRRQGSRIKTQLLKVKDALGIPSSWVMAGPLKHLWSKFQERTSKLEEGAAAFDFDVRGLHVAVLDDCVVSGRSLRYVADRIAAGGASKVTTAVLCWTEEGYGGQAENRPDVFLHRRIQWYPWSNNSDHWPAYQAWLKDRGIEHWE